MFIKYFLKTVKLAEILKLFLFSLKYYNPLNGKWSCPKINLIVQMTYDDLENKVKRWLIHLREKKNKNIHTYNILQSKLLERETIH